VLLSDGHANVGICEPDKLGSVAADSRGRGVTTSTIGLGLGYDETLLAALARGGAGNTHFAEEGDTAAAALASEVDGLLQQVVQAASLTVRPTGAVGSVTLFNDLPVISVDGGFTAELGDFVSGEERKLLLEIDVPAMAALGLAQVCSLELRWVELATMDTHTITVPVSVNVVPGDEAAGRIPNAIVRTERAFQQAQRDKQAATDALRAGNAPAAAAMYASAAEAVRGYADAEMQAEAGVLLDLAERAQHDDASRTAKLGEADLHRKGRRR
jgi:Ca-activated chloride channel family protein